MNKKWELINVDESKAERIEKQFNVGKLVARALATKNLKSDEEIE